MLNWRYGLFASLVLAACGSNAPQPTGEAWRIENNAAALRAASCPETVEFTRAEEINLNASPLDMTGLQSGTHLFGNTSAVGGWELTSDDPRFGGLSGLAVYPSGNLLAVSDQGAFVWITIENGRPAGARLAPLLDREGNPFEDKDMADSEGVTLVDGLALVSFERTHRVEAYDLEGCGAAARAARVSDVPTRVAGLGSALVSNNGVEAISYSPGAKTVLFGIETTSGRGQPFGRLDEIGVPVVSDRLEAPPEFALVGLDTPRFQPFALFRYFSRSEGNKNIIAYVDGTTTPPNALMERVRLDFSVPVDNFEGIAVQNVDMRTQRIWIVSDDNFSDSQRTLLMAFDLN